MMATPSPSIFMAMPLEVRQRIYQFCMPEGLCFNLSPSILIQYQKRSPGPYDALLTFALEEYSDDETECEPTKLDEYWAKPFRHYSSWKRSGSIYPGVSTQILPLCHQITDEVTDMLYGRNTFIVRVNDLWRLAESDIGTLQKMRKIILVFLPECSPDFSADHAARDGLFNVLILGIIVPCLEDLRDSPEKWRALSRPIFEYLGRTLPPTVPLMVDTRIKQFPIKFVEKLMPGSCRFQRLHAAAHILFRTREFEYNDDSVDNGPTSRRDVTTSCRDIYDDDNYGLYGLYHDD